MTVGDGRYGNDAHYLLKKGLDVVATDISDALLSEARAKGHIEQYRRENAESLTFKDGTFDFVLCKESFHHFPRPMLALYEMLRVCRFGVVLLEPNDVYVHARMATLAKHLVKKLVKSMFGRRCDRHRFEKTGNYVYALSRREVEKVALGMNYRAVAFCGMNDYYDVGVEYEKALEQNRVFRKVRRKIQWRNLLCRMRIADYGLMASIIFKTVLKDDLRRSLRDAGYDVIQLPQNPYVSCDAETQI